MRAHEWPRSYVPFTHISSLGSHHNPMLQSRNRGPQSALQSEGHTAGKGQTGLDITSAW